MGYPRNLLFQTASIRHDFWPHCAVQFDAKQQLGRRVRLVRNCNRESSRFPCPVPDFRSILLRIESVSAFRVPVSLWSAMEEQSIWIWPICYNRNAIKLLIFRHSIPENSNVFYYRFCVTDFLGNSKVFNSLEHLGQKILPDDAFCIFRPVFGCSTLQTLVEKGTKRRKNEAK